MNVSQTAGRCPKRRLFTSIARAIPPISTMDPGPLPEEPDVNLPSMSEFPDVSGHGVLEQKSEHACSYCGLDCPSSSVKCGTCNKWFCNCKGNLAGSHILVHLVNSRHQTVSLHETSPLGAETLECYNCGNTNIFSLGFVAAKQDSVIVILCRVPCAHQRDRDWETNDWQPLVEGRALLSWIVPEPAAEQKEQMHPVTNNAVRKLEASWRINKNASIDDLKDSEAPQSKLLPVLLRYNDAATYHNAWVPLIEAEAECSREIKASQALESISLEWGISGSGLHIAHFVLQFYESFDSLILVGEEIKLHYQNGTSSDEVSWSGKGTIIQLPSARSEYFTVEIRDMNKPVPTHLTTGFTIELMFNRTPYQRMVKAMRIFAQNEKSVSAHLYHAILGHEVVDVEFPAKVPKKLSVPGLAELNESQYKALTSALKKPLSLIQGPPGTGKTVTSASIVYTLTKVQHRRVLVCAPSNTAVDHLALKLQNAGLNVARVYAKSRETLTDNAVKGSVQLAADTLPANLKMLYNLKEQGNELNSEDYSALKKALDKAERNIIKKATVICCTCIGAMDWKINGQFHTVLIDESTQACEPEALIPVVKGAKQLILIGDHQQMGPVILDKRAGAAGLSQSLFERLIALGHVPHRLEVQYRMHPALSLFSSNMFYGGSLQNGVTSEDRSWPRSTFPWPVPEVPMAFWVNFGKEEMSTNGSSYLNRVEAMNVEKIISRLFMSGIRPEQIGVITPYKGQRAYISQYMRLNTSIATKREQYEEVELSSVDSFQGREKDFIILSCVRANEDRQIGFLSDPRRLNVALTRAKYGMVVLGNPKSLSRNNLWNRFLVHYRENGCLVEGQLDNLKFSLVSLSEMNYQNMPSARKAFNGNSNSFEEDNQSMLSYAPDDLDSFGPDQKSGGLEKEYDEQDDVRWPQLTANEASRLDPSNRASQKFGAGLRAGSDITLPNNIDQKDKDIQKIASAFVNALNI